MSLCGWKGALYNGRMQTLKRALPLNLAIYGLYLLLAVVMTWPLVTLMSTHFAGYPFGDAHEMTRHIWWIKHALQTGQPLIFQPLLGYPDGMQGVILWASPLQFFPGWLFAFFMPLPAAYNLFALLTLALNGWAAYWLVWKLTGVRPAALLGGLAFMTAPVIQGHLAGGHGNLLVQWPLPLLVYHLLRVGGLLLSVSGQDVSASSWRDIVWAVIFFVLTTMGHTLQLICAVLPLVAVIAVTLLIRREWRGLLRLVVTSIIGSGLLLLFLLPVLISTLATSAYTTEGGGVDYSIDLLGIVTPSFNHPLYGQLPYTHAVLGVNIVEGSSYIGLVAGLLALLGVWKVKRARWWLLLALVTWVLALGPLLKVFDHPLTIQLDQLQTYITLPYALLYNLPGFRLARAPGRFDFLLALVVAVLVGYGWSVVARSSRKRLMTIAPLVIGLLILLDYQSFWPLPTYNAVIPQAVYDLAKSDARAVFDVPWDNLLAAKDALWLQTAHEKPMIAGHVTRRTPVDPAKLTVLEATMKPVLLGLAGVDVVIVHKFYDADGTLMARAREKLGAPTYEDDQLALFGVPRNNLSLTDVYTYQPAEVSPNQSDLYVYMPESGWLNLMFSQRESSPAFDLKLDGQILRRWDANAFSYEMPVSVPISSAGFHTLTTEMTPPCPQSTSPLLKCTQSPPVMIYEIGSASAFTPQNFDSPIRYDAGVGLMASRIPSAVTTGQLALDLWWQFDQPRSEQDVRFIKVLDANGQPVASDDHSLGIQPLGGQWVETVSLSLPANLPAGTYTIYTGWYTYPDLTRFKVLSDVIGAADGWAQIGSFTVK